MRHFLFSLLALLAFSVTELSAQAGNPANASDTTTLQQQFDDMLRVSNRYQKFRVVNQVFLTAFIGNVNDSISVYTHQIGDLNQTITAQAVKIEGLAKNVSDRDAKIQALTEEKDSMNLLGMPLSKMTYSTIMWSAIFGLLALLALLFLRMQVALSGANEARNTNSQLSEDLAKAKKRCLEVEQDLGRKLQDEINRNRGR